MIGRHGKIAIFFVQLGFLLVLSFPTSAQDSCSAEGGFCIFTSPEGITLRYPIGITSNMRLDHFPANAPDYPSMTQLTLENWNGTEAAATIRIYPTAEYRTVNEYAANRLNDLQEVLEGAPLPIDMHEYPQVANHSPINMSGSMMRLASIRLFALRPQIVPFVNGNGLRYLTAFINNITTVSADLPEYYFEGLTHNGAYFIAARFPLHLTPNVLEGLSPASFSTSPVPGGAYNQAAYDRIRAASPESFSPMLEAIDAMISTLQLSPPASDQTPTATNCPDTLPSRLQQGGLGRVIPPDANFVRAEPTTSGEMIGSIPGDSEFITIEGPVCAEGFAWWRVIHEGLIGWTAEAGQTYWLEPVTDNPDFGVPVHVNYEGISFTYNSDIASSLVAEISPAESLDQDFDGNPEHIEFDFQNYVGFVPEIEVRGRYQKPKILVYSWQDVVGNTGETSQVQLTTAWARFHYILGWLYDENWAYQDGVKQPFLQGSILPPLGYQLHLQLLANFTEYDFAEGRGLRFLGYYYSGLESVTNESLMYITQAVSQDGNYFIAGFFPVTTSYLDTLPIWEESAVASYSAYIEPIMATLDNLKPSDFTPNLDYLDAIMMSLRVEPVDWND